MLASAAGRFFPDDGKPEEDVAEDCEWRRHAALRREGPIGLKFQVTDVRTPLRAVRRLVEKGNKVVLAGNDEESYVMNKATQVKVPVVRD